MKRFFAMMGASVVFLSMLLSCGGSENSGNEKVIGSEKVSESEKVSGSEIEATFVSASCFEGDCDFVFKMKDGKTISFTKNYINSDSPEIEYDFFDNETMGANEKFVGKTFLITYKFVEKGKIQNNSENIEELVDCNQILTIKMKQ